MIHHVDKEPRVKFRRMTLQKENILADIDSLTYKLAEVNVAEDNMKDGVASDSEDTLDAPILSSLLNGRILNLKKRLGFCLVKKPIVEAHDGVKHDPIIIFDLKLPERFDDINLEVAVGLTHDYLVRGVLLDWYMKVGTSFGAELPAEVQKLESQIVDIFRLPGFVNHPSLPYYPSYRSR